MAGVDHTESAANTKVCTGCHQEFAATTEFFYKHPRGKLGLMSRCVTCERERSRRYNASPARRATLSAWMANPENRVKCREATRRYERTAAGKAKAAAYKEAHKDATREYVREWQRRNRERIAAQEKKRCESPEYLEKKRRYQAEWQKAKRRANPGLTRLAREKVKRDPAKLLAFLAKRREWIRRRRQEDDVFGLNIQAGTDIRNALKRRPRRKGGRPLWWEKALGYSAPELKAHLEHQFIDGMTWENHGSLWEIDHIIPLAHFKNRADFETAWAITNLRPLLKLLNQAKGAKLIAA